MIAGKVGVTDVMIAVRCDYTDAGYEEKTNYKGSGCYTFMGNPAAFFPKSLGFHVLRLLNTTLSSTLYRISV